MKKIFFTLIIIYSLHGFSQNKDLIISGISPDVVKNEPDTAAFKKNGLITVKAGEVKSHLNETIISGGLCINTKTNADSSVMLFINANNAQPGFTVLITNADRNKFDLPERHYKGKMVKVTGEVVNYNNERVVRITNENQIYIVPK